MKTKYLPNCFKRNVILPKNMICNGITSRLMELIKPLVSPKTVILSVKIVIYFRADESGKVIYTNMVITN